MFLDPGTDCTGYIQVALISPTGKKYTRRLHRLLAEHFIPKQYGDGNLVDHIDNDRTNNKLSNLRWTNHEQNSQNTKCKKRPTYCIKWNEPRKVFEVSIPQVNARPKYIGRAETLEEAQQIRDNALKQS